MPGKPWKSMDTLVDRRPSRLRRRPGYGIVITTLPIPPVPDDWTAEERDAWVEFWSSPSGLRFRRSNHLVVNEVAHALAAEDCEEINRIWQRWFGRDFTDDYGREPSAPEPPGGEGAVEGVPGEHSAP
jgi:hypothetical protein